MKRAKGHGLFLSIIINMLFRSYWLILVCILIVLHFVLGWPLWLIVIPIVFWFVHALLITLILGWANTSGGTSPKPEQKNINPYSVKKDSENQEKAEQLEEQTK